MKKTKVIGTIGPVSTNKEVLTKLVEGGLNVIRLNMSHGDHAEQQERIDLIREVSNDTGMPVGILLDTKGPEVRTGTFEEQGTIIEKGQKVAITMDDVVGTKERFTVSYKGLINDVNIGNIILLDDGYVSVKVVDKTQNDIICEVLNTGKLKDRRGVNVPGVTLNFEFMSEKDKKDIIFAAEQNLDFVAASFVRNEKDVEEIRQVLNEVGNSRIQIISKVENQESVDKIDEVIEASDGIMVARGDLGVEVPAEDVPVIQKNIIRKCNAKGKIVITATQMLESMQDNPRPTRAEVSDVFNAVMDGTDAVMLSGESAAGKYPVESVITQATIVSRAEDAFDHDDYLRRQEKYLESSITDLVAYSAVTTADKLETVKFIVAITTSGTTAKVISRLKPRTPIIAVTSSEDVLNSLVANYGLYPILVKGNDNVETVIDNVIKELHAKGLVQEDDELVISAGSTCQVGTTDYMKVIKV